MGQRFARRVRAQAEDVRAMRGRSSPLFGARALVAVLGGLVLLVMLGLNAVGFGSGDAGAGLRQYTAPPGNTAAPVLSGSRHITLIGGSVVPIAVVGNVLTVSDGTWTGSPTFTYGWMHCDSSYANCSQIGGATSRSYTLSSADLGFTVVAVVTASNGSATRSAYANLRGNVGAPNPSPDAAATGLDWYPGSQPKPTVGQTLSPENDPSWWVGATPISFGYQWRRCDSLETGCSEIPGATSLSYTVTDADAGHVLEVVMVGSNQYGSNGYKNLFDTAAVVGTVVADTAAPSQPTNLEVSGRTGGSLTLSWDASRDDVGVTGYDVYVDGSKRATVTGTTYSYSGLTCGTTYTLAVAARDAAANVSTKASTTATTSACPPPPPPPDALGVDALLHRGGFLQSANGRYRLYLQAGDGNLVLYDGAGHALWATDRPGGDILAVQSDGNLVDYSSSRQALWASNTMGSGGSRLVVQDDGNVVLYTSTGRAVWSTNTATGATPPPSGHPERESIHHPVHTFANYHNASGQGRDVAAGQTVQVSCKVHDGAIRSVNPDGYWYRIASSPWDDHYYAPANTFLNGDPPNGPYSHNTDFAVPDCGASGATGGQATEPPTRSVSVKQGPGTHTSFCTSTSCSYVTVSFTGFPPGRHVVACYGSYPPAGRFYSYTTSATTSNVCVFGYRSYSVWATVDGVSSNRIAWGSPGGASRSVPASGAQHGTQRPLVAVSGSVSCSGHDVVGVYVTSTGGGGGWAAWSAESGHRATFSTVPTQIALPSTIELHVGCGGNGKEWWSDNWTSSRTIEGSVTVYAACAEGTTRPRQGVNSRCSWRSTAPPPTSSGVKSTPSKKAQAPSVARQCGIVHCTDYYSRDATKKMWAALKGQVGSAATIEEATHIAACVAVGFVTDVAVDLAAGAAAVPTAGGSIPVGAVAGGAAEVSADLLCEHAFKGRFAALVDNLRTAATTDACYFVRVKRYGSNNPLFGSTGVTSDRRFCR